MGSYVDTVYRSGKYYENRHRGEEDSLFKTTEFIKLFEKTVARLGPTPRSYTDVGCGSGKTVQEVAKRLKENYSIERAQGYDVSPHIEDLKHPGIEYIRGDFCDIGDDADLVTLFDVFEHVPDPVGFIRSVSAKCRIMGLHIPLDDSLNSSLRDLFRKKLDDPGHLIFLDTPRALSLLAFAGLRVVDYSYTFSFMAPSGHAGFFSKCAFPFRYLGAKVNPWLLSKTIGGASLMVIALTPRGFSAE